MTHFFENVGMSLKTGFTVRKIIYLVLYTMCDSENLYELHIHLDANFHKSKLTSATKNIKHTFV